MFAQALWWNKKPISCDPVWFLPDIWRATTLVGQNPLPSMLLIFSLSKMTADLYSPIGQLSSLGKRSTNDRCIWTTCKQNVWFRQPDAFTRQCPREFAHEDSGLLGLAYPRLRMARICFSRPQDLHMSVKNIFVGMATFAKVRTLAYFLN